MKVSSSDYDPPAHERVHYRHHLSGDLGYLVRRDGKDCIKYDRPGHDMVIPFTAKNVNEWVPCVMTVKLTPLQRAMIAYSADKQFCHFIGAQGAARRDWMNMSESERIRYMTDGPVGPSQEERRFLFDAILETLEVIDQHGSSASKQEGV